MFSTPQSPAQFCLISLSFSKYFVRNRIRTDQSLFIKCFCKKIKK